MSDDCFVKIAEKKPWEEKKIEKMWLHEGFGQVVLAISTTDGSCYHCNLKKLGLKLARLKEEAKEDVK